MWTSSRLLVAAHASLRPSIELGAALILLDTSVVSELMRSAPEPDVEAWVRGQPPGNLCFSSASEAEFRYGAATLPAGRRCERLFADIEAMLRRAFGKGGLPFDRQAAGFYGDVAAMRRSAGRLPDPVGCLIAAIARSRGLAVATQNVVDFEGIGVENWSIRGLRREWGNGGVRPRQDRRPAGGRGLGSHRRHQRPVRVHPADGTRSDYVPFDRAGRPLAARRRNTPGLIPSRRRTRTDTMAKGSKLPSRYFPMARKSGILRRGGTCLKSGQT